MATGELAAKLQRRSQMIERSELEDLQRRHREQCQDEQKQQPDDENHHHDGGYRRMTPAAAAAAGSDVVGVNSPAAVKLHECPVEHVEDEDDDDHVPVDFGPRIKSHLQPYAEFREFTRKQLQQYQKMFNRYWLSTDL